MLYPYIFLLPLYHSTLHIHQMYWIKQAEKQPIWTERFNVRATHLIDRRNEYDCTACEIV